MTTENNEEWRPRNRYNDNGQEDEGQRERRPYQSFNRTSYGNQTGDYNRQEGNYRQEGSYNRTGNYNRQENSYDRPRSSYDRSGNYDRSNSDYNNRGNNYERREGGGYNNSRPQRSYDNNYQPRSYNNQPRSYDNQPRPYDNQPRPYDNQPRPYDNRPRSYDNHPQETDTDGVVKKRRPRVGEVPTPVRNTNNYNPNRPQTGGYNRDTRGGGGYQQRPYNNNRPNQGGGYNRNQGGREYDPNAKYSVKKQMKYREENFDPNEPIRLNKYLANAGICSRREADEFIQAGLVKVNDVVVAELGTKVKRSDNVVFHEEPVKLEQKVYVLLNKPKNCVTTADDPQERLTVMDLVKTACQERIFPVGRLDRNTTGVLLLTNDGDLASKLTHPKFLKKKIYHVWLDKDVAVADMQKMAEGVELEDGEIHADAISYVTDTDKDQVGVEIHSGKNRVVRRMFEAIGYHVMRLDRVYFAGLTKKNLKRGQWRYLNDKEVAMLRMGAFD
jgi:23S rRNA pseudouridine2605 synthase